MSTISSDGGDVDFLCSSQSHDNLAEMMTSKEISQSGTVRVVRNRVFYNLSLLFFGFINHMETSKTQ